LGPMFGPVYNCEAPDPDVGYQKSPLCASPVALVVLVWAAGFRRKRRG
jgi:hypothetical protein